MFFQNRASKRHSKHGAGGVGHTAAGPSVPAGPLGGYVTTTPWQPAAASDAAGSVHLYADTTVAWVRSQIELADGQAADLNTRINEYTDQIAMLNWRSADLRDWMDRHGEHEDDEQQPATYSDAHTAQPHHALTGEDYYDSGQAAEDQAQRERDQAENAAKAEPPVYVHWTPDAISWPLCGDQFALHHTTDTTLVDCPQCTAALRTTVPQARLPLGLAEPLDEQDPGQLSPYWLPDADAQDGVPLLSGVWPPKNLTDAGSMSALDGMMGGSR